MNPRGAEGPVRILASPASAQRVRQALTRRRFLGLGLAGLAGAALAPSALAGCGKPSSTPAPAGTAPAGDAGGALTLYTWAGYHDPALLTTFGDVTLDVFSSNEEALDRLVADGGGGGYDIVVPSGPYIPEFVAEGLIQRLDTSRLAGFGNVSPRFLDMPWDPHNAYSVPKCVGWTGWLYDTTVVTTPIRTWGDFLHAARTEASGRTTVIDAPPDLLGIYFWANGIDWNTDDPADLEAARKYLVQDLAPHLAAFDSYPSENLAGRNYALCQAWNGDARQALLAAGPDAGRFAWSVGRPRSELWVDSYCIAEGAPNLDRAYAFIDFMLEPSNSATDLTFHGFETGVKGVRALVPPDLAYVNMIFLTDAEAVNLDAQVMNDSQATRMAIFEEVKAAVPAPGGG